MDLLNQKLNQILLDSLQAYYSAIEHSLQLNLILLQPPEPPSELDREPLPDLAPFDYDQLCQNSLAGHQSCQTQNHARRACCEPPQQPGSSPSQSGSRHPNLMETTLSHTSSSSNPTHRSTPATSPHSTPACSDRGIHPSRAKHSQWPLSQSIASARIFRSGLPSPPDSAARPSDTPASLPPASRLRSTCTPPLRHAPYPSRSPHRRPDLSRPQSLPPRPQEDIPTGPRLPRLYHHT